MRGSDPVRAHPPDATGPAFVSLQFENRLSVPLICLSVPLICLVCPFNLFVCPFNFVSEGRRTVTLRKVHTVLLDASSVVDPSVRDGVSIRVETR